MHLAFEDKVTLVTSAGSGLGLATAKAFADAGASVVLADNHEKAVPAEAEDLVAAGHKALAIRCDVADEGQVAAMVKQAVTTFGRLDAAFNNAGVQSPLAEAASAAQSAALLPCQGSGPERECSRFVRSYSCDHRPQHRETYLVIPRLQVWACGATGQPLDKVEAFAAK